MGIAFLTFLVLTRDAAGGGASNVSQVHEVVGLHTYNSRLSAMETVKEFGHCRWPGLARLPLTKTTSTAA